MERWEQLLEDTITDPEKLAKIVNVDGALLRKINHTFPLRVNPYYLSLIRKKNDAIWKQAIPDYRELEDSGIEDPLAEESQSPVPCITHRYPDRVLFYVSAKCSMYCRFCTRKRKVGVQESVSESGVEKGLEYIRNNREIRDVIISGGDPLMLQDAQVDYILSNLKSIRHVEIIRIGTRMPVTMPYRITEKLCTVLKKYHPLFINTHFNHPFEITAQSIKACTMLVNAGIPLGNQSVLLKGVNDKPEIMKALVRKLLAIRVKPYYLYQADLVKGTGHFRTTVKTGLTILAALRGHTSGMAVPHYVIDAPGGGGKIALTPNPIVYADRNEICLENYQGNLYSYPSTPHSLSPIDALCL